jgi:hypothetical protein
MPIDLDAARAARNEAMTDRPRPQVVFGGKTFDLPHELPFAVFLRLAELRRAKDEENVSEERGIQMLDTVRSIVTMIFADQTDAFLDCGPSIDDLMALIEALMDSYELDLPESSAPPSQS